MLRFDHWDVDNKSEQNDTTGPNILLKALPRLSFFDPSTGTVVSRRKVPRDLKGFGKLNKPSQSHLIAMTFDPEIEGVTIYNNETCNQYGARIQRYFHGNLKIIQKKFPLSYFRKLYQKIFERLLTKTKLKEKQMRSFDLYSVLTQ